MSLNFLHLRAFLSKYWYVWISAYSFHYVFLNWLFLRSYKSWREWEKEVFFREFPHIGSAYSMWLLFLHRWMFLYGIPTVPADSSGLGSELSQLVWRKERCSVFSIVFTSLISQQLKLIHQNYILKTHIAQRCIMQNHSCILLCYVEHAIKSVLVTHYMYLPY